MPAFSLLISPRSVTLPLHQLTERYYHVIVQSTITSAISVSDFSPVTSSAQERLIRPVSYYAFFKGWLLLSQPPGCNGVPTSLNSLSHYLGTLIGGLGFFPLDDGRYHPPSGCRIVLAGIRSLVRFGKALGPPSRSRALPPAVFVRRYT